MHRITQRSLNVVKSSLPRRGNSMFKAEAEQRVPLTLPKCCFQIRNQKLWIIWPSQGTLGELGFPLPAVYFPPVSPSPLPILSSIHIKHRNPRVLTLWSSPLVLEHLLSSIIDAMMLYPESFMECTHISPRCWELLRLTCSCGSC